MQGFIVRLLAWKWLVFSGNSVRFTPEVKQEVSKHNAPGHRG